MKTCKTCGRKLPLEAFSKNGNRLRSKCRQCDAEKSRLYHKQHKTQISEQRRLYRKQHKAQVSEWRRLWRDGHKAQINEVRRLYSMTLLGFITNAWAHLNSRTINGSHPDYNNRFAKYYLDKGIRLETTREEFAAWCTEQWPHIQQIRANGEVASIDRIDAKKHYSISNMRIISLRENSRLGSETARLRRESI